MMDVPVGRTSDNAITGTLLLLAGGTAEQVERYPVLMAMGNELVNTGGPGMGIRVKLINNYMSIALNALPPKPPCCVKRWGFPSTWL